MGSDVGQIYPTASLHRDNSISYALVCEISLSYMDTYGGLLYSPDLIDSQFQMSIPGPEDSLVHQTFLIFFEHQNYVPLNVKSQISIMGVSFINIKCCLKTVSHDVYQTLNFVFWTSSHSLVSTWINC